MRRVRAVLGVLAAAIFGAGCGSVSADGGGSGGDDALVGRTFVSTAVSPPLEPGTRLRIDLGTDKLGMHAGCNHFGGTYRAADGRLRVSAVGGTEMACADPLMAQDERMVGLLAADPAYKLAGDTLTLSGGDTTIELVDEEIAIPDAALTDTQWVLEGIVSGSDETGAVASVPAGVRSTLRFAAGGRLSAELGCNGGGGMVTVTDSTLDIREFGRTLMACGGAKDQVEKTVAGVLTGEAEVGYVVDGQTLTLRSGATGLIYRAG